MGGASLSAMPASDQLTRKIEDLDIKDGKSESDKSYVYIDNAMDTSQRSADGAPSYGPYEATVSVSAAEKWEKELLEDPKVRPTRRLAVSLQLFY